MGLPGLSKISDSAGNTSLYNCVRFGKFRFIGIQRVINNIQWEIDKMEYNHPCEYCGCDGSCGDDD